MFQSGSKSHDPQISWSNTICKFYSICNSVFGLPSRVLCFLVLCGPQTSPNYATRLHLITLLILVRVLVHAQNVSHWSIICTEPVADTTSHWEHMLISARVGPLLSCQSVLVTTTAAATAVTQANTSNTSLSMISWFFPPCRGLTGLLD